MQLTAKLKGDMSDPRVLFELSAVNNSTGTIRVFEMLPYFSNRATLESVYLEATILAPATVHMQAEISIQPSCPLRQYPCPHYNIQKSAARLDLMGVNQLILVTDPVVTQARDASFLEETDTIMPWHLFKVRNPVALAGVFEREPIQVPLKDWRDLFYEWFSKFDGNQPYLVSSLSDTQLFRSPTTDLTSSNSACSPKVVVGFKKLTLKTKCPGKPHFLKFSFHPAWQTNDSDTPLFLVSPGFIGLIPHQETVTLEFSYRTLWRVADGVSFITLILIVFYNFSSSINNRSTKNNACSI